MWLWVLGAILSVGGVFMARMAFNDEAFLAPVLGWCFVGIAMFGACLLVYRAATVGIIS